jgi:hypothetical protein
MKPPLGIALPPKATSTEVGMIMKLEEWAEFGRRLGKAEGELKWLIGDWWNAGHRYGDRKDIVQADDWTGPSYDTCVACVDLDLNTLTVEGAMQIVAETLEMCRRLSAHTPDSRVAIANAHAALGVVRRALARGG